MRKFIGIDPGTNGGMAWVGGGCLMTFKLKGATERDVWEAMQAFVTTDVADCFAVIESVHSSPQMGVVSAFTFGRSLGFLRGVLIAAEIAFEEVTPQKWQKALGCLSKGDKNVTKARAQQLFPAMKVTHANADCLLLAEYAWRVWHERYSAAS